jgi:DNA-directed RNA polymerase subunit RPC12/RpoP
MAADDEAGTDLEPQDAFALVSHELRFDILQALWDASDEALTFSQLRAAVGNPDVGNFNYHLQQLLGPFVVKHENEDSPCYELTIAASYVLGAIESGSYHRTERVGPTSVEGSCPECRGDIEAIYEENLARIRCLACELRLLTVPLPAGAVAAYDAADLPNLLDRWVRKTNRAIRAHICPVCSGRIDGRLTEEADRSTERIMTSYTCRRCEQTFTGQVATWLVEQPALVQFAIDHGVDTREWQVWSGDWQRSIDVERLQREPLEVAVRVHIDEETLELVVDETVEVIDVCRADG